jgi:hypothetical protein
LSPFARRRFARQDFQSGGQGRFHGDADVRIGRSAAARLARLAACGRRSPREIWPQLLAGLLGALLMWQCVRLLWVLLTPLSPLGAWQPQAAVIASPAERRALFTSFDPFFRGNVQGPASATVTSRASRFSASISTKRRAAARRSSRERTACRPAMPSATRSRRG